MLAINPSLNLDFAGQNGTYATHPMHSFSAKFPPQLPNWAIQEFTSKGDTVFDPFTGSGTTLVEARLLGRHSVGTEIDPLSRLITKVKTTPIDTLILYRYSEELAANMGIWFAKLREQRKRGKGLFSLKLGIEPPDFPNRDYWYYPETIEELTLLLHLIDQIEHHDTRDFLYLVFSGIIYTKGKGSMANVMDLAHSRPHRVMKETPPDVEKAFLTKLNRLRKMLENFSAKAEPNVECKIVGYDARHVPALKSNSIDLVFNSPPYVNAIDYQRGHKFSVFWLAKALGTSSESYLGLAKDYVGSDRIPKREYVNMNLSIGVAGIESVASELADKGQTKLAGVVKSYFYSMRACIAEMLRVVKVARPAIILVGASNIKGVSVNTPELLGQLAETITYEGARFKCAQIVERKLDRDKRQLPVTRGIFGDGMKTEHTIILEKIAA